MRLGGGGGGGGREAREGGCKHEEVKLRQL